MGERILYETHMHTPLCLHAEGEPEQYAAVAERRGLAGITVTCHNPMPPAYGHTGRMREEQVDEYLGLIQRCREAYAGRVDVRSGIECDHFPGYEAYVGRQIESLDLDYVIGSVHPHLAIWRRQFAGGPAFETQRNYFNHLADAAESGMFDCISHPDLIKNMTPDEWDFEAIADRVGRCLDRIAGTGVALELNTSGRLKHIAEMNPTPAMLVMMCERRIPVVLGADAHVPDRIGDMFIPALRLLSDCGYTHTLLFQNRKAYEVPIEYSLASLVEAEAEML